MASCRSDQARVQLVGGEHTLRGQPAEAASARRAAAAGPSGRAQRISGRRLRYGGEQRGLGPGQIAGGRSKYQRAAWAMPWLHSP